jgi:hypothetical protein
MMRNEYGEAFLADNKVPNMFTQYGFETAETSSIMNRLQTIVPYANNCMNTAFVQSSFVLQDIYKATKTLTPGKQYEFVHIFITTSYDTSSRNTLEEVTGSMNYLNQVFGTTLKTYLVGINVGNNQKACQDLMTIKLVGGDNCSFSDVSEEQIEHSFEELKMAFSKFDEKININYQCSSNYVVLFTIDYSMFMTELNCQRVLLAVSNMIKSLARDDLVGCVIYNDSVKNVVKEINIDANAYIPVNQPAATINVQPIINPPIVNVYSQPSNFVQQQVYVAPQQVYIPPQQAYIAPQQVYIAPQNNNSSARCIRSIVTIIILVIMFIFVFTRFG